MDKSHNNRRSWFLSKGFQFQFIWISIVPVLLLAICLMIISFFVWGIIIDHVEEWDAYSTKLQTSLLTVRELANSDTSSVTACVSAIDEKVNFKSLLNGTPKFEAEFLLRVNVILILSINAVVILIGIWIALILLHRIIGPMNRFQQLMQKIAEGKVYQRMHFRSKDEIMLLIETNFNTMIANLAQNISEAQHSSNEAMNAVDKLNPKDKKSVNDVRVAIKKLQDQLMQFECKSPPESS